MEGKASCQLPALSTHLMQEAHEVVEDGVVVFRKALQDLAAVGHPQAALHTCNGRRVLPESFPGGRHCSREDRLSHCWACGSHLLPGRAAVLSKPLSYVSSTPFFTMGAVAVTSQKAQKANHFISGNSPGQRLANYSPGVRWPIFVNKALLAQTHTPSFTCHLRLLLH